MQKEFNLKEETKRVLLQNRRNTDGFQYTIPSPKEYPYQWLWDSCFHIIILSHFEIEDAKKELRSLLSRQFENGMIPHIIYWEKHEQLNIDWGVEGTSSLTQPPLLAYALQRILDKDNDQEFLKETYPKLNKYYRHILTRDRRNRHLVGIINPDESGEDNSPRFDIALGLPPRHKFKDNNERRFDLFKKNCECNFDATNCMHNFFWVKDVAFNSYLVENLECLSKLAYTFGDEEDARYFLEEAGLIKDAMKHFMYQDGAYWTVCGPDYQKVMTKTWAMFAPMVAGIVSEADAKKLVEEHLLNEEEFWSVFPVPTTAMDEEAFHVTGSDTLPTWLQPNWRGPVWMATNWFVYRGLRRYRFNKEAEEIKNKSIALLEQSGFREYYNPLTGEGMGAEDFTWGGLALDME